MGIIAEVYRRGKLDSNGNMLVEDLTMNGWSGIYDRVCVINAEGSFEPDANCPAVLIRRHRTMKALHVVSEDHYIDGAMTMFGGNFLYSSDSRFGAACRKLLGYDPYAGMGAVSIHDRCE